MRGIYIFVQLFPIRAPYSNDSRLSDAFPNSLRHNVQYRVTARKYMPVHLQCDAMFLQASATYRECSAHAPGLDSAASLNASSAV